MNKRACVPIAVTVLLLSASAAHGAGTGGAVASPPAAFESTSAKSTNAKRSTVPGVKGKIVKGLALAPGGAPDAVKEAIWAGNDLIGKPYVYGGGHASFEDKGYDCSSSISYALHGGDLLDSPLDSGSFMSWGAKGTGSWITVYTNPGHAFITIAGIRLDTSAADDPSGKKGPRWRPPITSTSGYVKRHPTGY